MRDLRINFTGSDAIFENAGSPFEPIKNQELPISAELKQEMDTLCRMHETALARDERPDGKEIEFFRKSFSAVVPKLTEELKEYGTIVDENFPDVFLPDLQKAQNGPDLQPARESPKERPIEKLLKRAGLMRLRRDADRGDHEL